MKKLILFCVILILGNLYSQSPYFSIKFIIADTSTAKHIFEINSRNCKFNYEPKYRSGDYWFGIDTTQLNWDALPDSMYSVLVCTDGRDTGTRYENSNQGMIWEHIYKYTITRDYADNMIIVFPVLIKAFVSYIDLGKIPYIPGGYFELTNDLVYEINTKNGSIMVSLPDNIAWKSINTSDRKIKIN